MLLVGCYVRVSTDNQIENYSIEEQVQRLKSYCNAMDWNNYKFYKDPGHSGGNTNRPGLTHLLSDIKDGKINMVVVYKLDRLSRSQKDTLILIEDEFLSRGVEFTSVSEKFDTSTPFGRATLGMLSVFAQLEKDQITERFTMGRIGRSKAGYYHGGPTPPTGYNYIDGELIIDEFKAAQVREVYSRFLSGYSVNSIRKYMADKYGGWTSHALVLNVLRNSAYIGKVKFKGNEYDGVHEPIVTAETHNRVQALLTSPERENAKTAPQKTPFRAGYMLSSMILCKRCGARYSASHGYYKCYSRSKNNKRQVKDPNCKNNHWSIEELDQIILDEIKQLRYSPGQINSLFRDRTLTQVPNQEDIDNKIKGIDRQMSKLLDLYQMDNVPFEQITERINKLQSDKEKLSKTEPALDEVSKEEFSERLNNIDNIESSATEEKRLFVGTLIETIGIDGNSIEIKWRI